MPANTKKRRSSKSAGQTAMRHAREVAAVIYEGCPALEAQKSVIWIPDGKGGRRPISRQEDLFGVFDLLFITPSRPVLVQVTTDSVAAKATASSARRKKIRAWILENSAPAASVEIYVWAWVPRKYFHAWKWQGEGWGSRFVLRKP